MTCSCGSIGAVMKCRAFQQKCFKEAARVVRRRYVQPTDTEGALFKACWLSIYTLITGHGASRTMEYTLLRRRPRTVLFRHGLDKRSRCCGAIRHINREQNLLELPHRNRLSPRNKHIASHFCAWMRQGRAIRERRIAPIDSAYEAFKSGRSSKDHLSTGCIARSSGCDCLG